MSYLSVETEGSLGGSGGASLAGGRLRMTPGRVVALTLGVPIVIALIAVSGLSIVSALDIEHFPVNATFPVVDNKVTTDVEGNLTLRQAAVSEAQLSGTATYSIVRPAVSTNGATVRYRCRWTMGDCGLSGTLTVPPQADVTLNTGGGDVTMANYTGNLTLNLDGGNLNAGAVAGSMTVNSAGGDVTVTTLGAPVALDTDGGNINIGAVSSTLGTVKSEGGDVTMTFTKIPTNLTIDSNGGNVQLTLPSNDHGYSYDVTTNGGNENTFPSANPRSTDKITVESNGGDVTID